MTGFASKRAMANSRGEDMSEYFEYLVDLRDSGETNMWGAVPYLMRDYPITKDEAKEILLAWIRSFDR